MVHSPTFLFCMYLVHYLDLLGEEVGRVRSCEGNSQLRTED